MADLEVPRQKSRPLECPRDADGAQDASATREKAAQWHKWHRLARHGGHSCLPRGTKGLCAVAEAGTRRLAHHVASLARDFLIANLELEFGASGRKQGLGPKSNRKYFAIFHLAFSACEGRRNLTRRSSVTGMGLGMVPQVNRTGRSACATEFPSLVTGHSPLVTLLIHGGAIKTPRNRFNYSSLTISNRR